MIVSIVLLSLLSVLYYHDKNYYHDSGHLFAWMCILHCLVSTCPQSYEKHMKMARNISDVIDLDKELQVFLLEGSKSDVYGSSFSPQIENAQNLYPNFISLSWFYLVSFKYLLNIVIVHLPSFSEDTLFEIPNLFSPSECEMLTKSCLPMHHTCALDNDISPNDISDDNIINNIIMLQYYSALYICVSKTE